MRHQTETTRVAPLTQKELPQAAFGLIGAVYGLAIGLVVALAFVIGVLPSTWAADIPGRLPALQLFIMAAGALAGAVIALLLAVRRQVRRQLD